MTCKTLEADSGIFTLGSECGVIVLFITWVHFNSLHTMPIRPALALFCQRALPDWPSAPPCAVAMAVRPLTIFSQWLSHP